MNGAPRLARLPARRANPHLSVLTNSVPAMGIRRQIQAGALRGDDRELQFQLVNLLNQVQEKNERCRGLLLDGNLPGLVTMGRAISDLGTTLMILSARQDPDQDTTGGPIDYDYRARAAGQHLERD